VGRGFSRLSEVNLTTPALVASRARRREHTNSWLFMLDDRVWLAPGVRDVIAELAVAAAAL
jgi:hypothetical protein